MSKAGKNLPGNVFGPDGTAFCVNSACGNRAYGLVDEEVRVDYAGRVTLPQDLVEGKAIVGPVNLRLNIDEAMLQLTGKSPSRSTCYTILKKLKPEREWIGAPYVYPNEIRAAVAEHVEMAKAGLDCGHPNLVRRVKDE